MKYVLMALAILSSSGCGRAERAYAHYTGDAAEICHDGVIYLQFTSGATVKYNTDGTVAQCKK